MPEVLRMEGFIFYFFSREGNEPPHIHVRKDENRCKYWLVPISCDYNFGFKSKELKKIEGIIHDHFDFLKEAYDEYHSRI